MTPSGRRRSPRCSRSRTKPADAQLPAHVPECRTLWRQRNRTRDCAGAVSSIPVSGLLKFLGEFQNPGVVENVFLGHPGFPGIFEEQCRFLAFLQRQVRASAEIEHPGVFAGGQPLFAVVGEFGRAVGGPGQFAGAFKVDRSDRVVHLLLGELEQQKAAYLEENTKELHIRQAEERIAPGAELEGAYWDNYPEVVASWDDYAVTFGKDGMSVGFSPYELAYYAAGSQVFLISYDTLDPYLSDYGRQLLEMSVPATESHES